MPATVATAASELIACEVEVEVVLHLGEDDVEAAAVERVEERVAEEDDDRSTGAPAVIDRGSRIAGRNDPGKVRTPLEVAPTLGERTSDLAHAGTSTDTGMPLRTALPDGRS